MRFNLLFGIFVVVTVLDYILLEIKIDKLKNEVIEKDKLISAFVTLDKAIKKLNDGFKDHERRLNSIEGFLLPEEHEEPENTCENCKFYDLQYGSVFKCKKLDCTYVSECNKACGLFEKKKSLDEDENVVYYVNNVKVDISSKEPHVIYKIDRILTYEEYVDRISRLFLDGAIGVATMNELLERLKQ